MCIVCILCGMFSLCCLVHCLYIVNTQRECRVGWLASQQEGPWFESQVRVSPCVEVSCSPSVYMCFLWCPPTVHRRAACLSLCVVPVIRWPGPPPPTRHAAQMMGGWMDPGGRHHRLDPNYLCGWARLAWFWYSTESGSITFYTVSNILHLNSNSKLFWLCYSFKFRFLCCLVQQFLHFPQIEKLEVTGSPAVASVRD